VLCLLTGDRPGHMWWRIHSEAETVLGAYLQGKRSVPEPKDLAALNKQLDSYFVDGRHQWGPDDDKGDPAQPVG